MHKDDRVEMIESYIRQLVIRLTIRTQDKREIEEEYRQHLYEGYYYGLEKGMTQQQAAEAVLRQFGDVTKLKDEINQSYGSAARHFLLQEGLIWSLILIAAILGPYILINASFQLYFIICPLVYMTLAGLFYHLIMNKVHGWIMPLSCAIMAYIYTMTQFGQGEGLSLEMLFIGANGIFTWGTIHTLWLLLCITHYQKAIKMSFIYWTFIALSIMFVHLLPNSESATIFLNVIMLYAFLQQWVGAERVWLWFSVTRTVCAGLFRKVRT